MSEHEVPDFQQLSMFGTEAVQTPDPSPKPPKPAKEGKAAKALKTPELFDVDRLRISESQPRVHLDEAELEDLSASIRKHGVLQPVIVQLEGDAGYTLIAGQRRLLAARKAGLKKIPAVVAGGDPFEIALIENLQRSDLTCMEEAEAMNRLKERNGYTLEEVRAIVGKSKTTVSETLSLVRLPESIRQECLRNSGIAKSILVEIAKKPSPEEMIEAFERYRSERTPRHVLRNAKQPDPKGRKIGLSFVKSVARRLDAIQVEGLKNKQRAQMKEKLAELHLKIGDLLGKLGP